MRNIKYKQDGVSVTIKVEDLGRGYLNDDELYRIVKCLKQAGGIHVLDAIKLVMVVRNPGSEEQVAKDYVHNVTTYN